MKAFKFCRHESYRSTRILLFLFLALAFVSNSVASAPQFGPAIKLAFTPNPLSLAESSCAPSTVWTVNIFGQPTLLTSAKTLDINQGPASLSFYSDPGCTQKSSRFTIRSDTSSYTFYMTGTALGTFSIRAQVAGLQAATQKVTVTVQVVGGQEPPTIAPAPALAVGYTRLAFGDEFNSTATISPDGYGSYKWYTTNFYDLSASLPSSGYKVGGGYLTLLTDTSGYSHGIATATPTQTSGVWQHGYFEARIRFNPKGYKEGGWPAFWSYSLEGALGSVENGSYFGELDFMECYPLGSPCTYITTVHQWQHNSWGNTSVAQNSNSVPTVPPNTDVSQWHVYGCLWTPNQVQWYLDNKLVTTVAVGPGTAFTALEQNHMLLILGTGKNWPMDVDYVHVWQ